MSIILILSHWMVFVFTSNNASVNDRNVSIERKEVRKGSILQKEFGSRNCLFDNPDTSVSGILLRDPESATRVLKVNRLNGDTTYNFYSDDKLQVLSVTVHAGDGYSQVSIFHINYAGKLPVKPSVLSVRKFSTEKGIRLGLTKNDVIKKLGTCYSKENSTKDKVTLRYRLEDPHDSRTKLLGRQNMPVYYATCKFKNDLLVDYEFGFEYP